MFGWEEYRGYVLRGCTVPGTSWVATGPGGANWFEAPSKELLKEEIDKALDSLPPPLY